MASGQAQGDTGGSARSTMEDVARRAGTSTATVSAVVNGNKFVSPGLAERVRAAMTDLNYRPNLVAGSLRSRSTRVLALVIPMITNPSFALMATAAEDAACSLGYSLTICITREEREREQRYVDMLAGRRVDGLVLALMRDEDRGFDPLLEAGVPVVCADRVSTREGDAGVTFDNLRSGYLGTRHLLDLGHRRIACIAGPLKQRLTARQRVEGYRQALQEAAVLPDPALVVEGDWSIDSGSRAALTLLGQPEPPTAIFASNDNMAVGCLRAAKALGLHIPNDLSVIGLDNIPLSAMIEPALTTVAEPFDRMGAEAVKLLVKKIAGKPLPKRLLVLSPELVVRDSTAPPGCRAASTTIASSLGGTR